MKKIMFSDRYRLTGAVLCGDKTITRRIIKGAYVAVIHLKYEGSFIGKTADGDSVILPQPTYKIGEEVAIAQNYETCWDYYKVQWESRNDPSDWHAPDAILGDAVEETKGYRNKMFVKAEYMPHRIRITGIKVERLQDISDGDCLKEGITTITEGKNEVGNAYGWDPKIDALKRDSFFTPRAAFAALIDRISGRGTWQSNPWVYVYTFELIK